MLMMLDSSIARGGDTGGVVVVVKMSEVSMGQNISGELSDDESEPDGEGGNEVEPEDEAWQEVERGEYGSVFTLKDSGEEGSSTVKYFK